MDIKALLPELKRLVSDLSEDLLQRAIAQPEVDSGLREAYAQIEKGGRTADAFEVWREDYLDQVAVAWVLGCVFVRFMEDNHLIDECWLAGEGERRKLAEDTHELYFRAHPHDSDREYFEHVFHEVGKIPACRDLFAEGKTPLWAVGPSGDMAMKLLAFWRDVVPETGKLKRSFNHERHETHESKTGNSDSSFRVFSVFRGSSPDSDTTRFLGDLYQDLSERARKKYALLQTPVFVEEFILDRTLNPAIDEFGLDEVRMVDPTCGSGHFLLGSFARLFDLWIKRKDNEVVAAQKALDGVWGCDINPFAVAIARFRLIVAALRACGIKRLKDAPAWNIHLATGDSLLFGSRWDREGKKKSEQQFLGTEEESWAPEIYACEDKEAISEVLGQQYHAVVGNPPYITPKDRSLNEAYRERYPQVCHRQYSLAVPFMERFIGLAVCGVGYIGQITANSFMKREFGKKLIESFFPTVDLTHVIDNSGAYIPGHGTPTVILFARNRAPVSDTLRTVMGIRGEPSTPDDPSRGLVWTAIIEQIDQPGSQSDYVSVGDSPRDLFHKHPWSIGGGGAAELKEQLDEQSSCPLHEKVSSIGFFQDTHADEAFVQPDGTPQRQGIVFAFRRQVRGDNVRDWQYPSDELIFFPYDTDLNQWGEVPKEPKWAWLFQLQTELWSRSTFGGGTYRTSGRPWFDYHQFPKDRARTPLSIVYGEVATHNHFVLDRGGKVFNRTAPVIKLPAEVATADGGTRPVTEDDHLALLGLLNSSTACFWMKQVCHQKQMMGGDGIRIESKTKVPYAFNGTALGKLPIPEAWTEDPLQDRLLQLTREMDSVSQHHAQLTGRLVLIDGELTASAIRERWQSSVERRRKLRARQVFLQEQIDFVVYRMFDLVGDDLVGEDVSLNDAAMSEGDRPFCIVDGANEDGFPVPADVPSDWPDDLKSLWSRRIAAMKDSRELRLIESAMYKRRWIGRQGLFNHQRTNDELGDAAKEWLLDRLESYFDFDGRMNAEGKVTAKLDVDLVSVARLGDIAAQDEQFIQVAEVYRDNPAFDVNKLVAELVNEEHVPLLPVLRYKPSGIRKRAAWERTWELQRQQDAGRDVGNIPVPPKYSSSDFISTGGVKFWKLRGKLDVPKERWISFPHCETESDPSLVVGWAGWNHLQQATALIAYYDARKREGWDAKRLTPLLAGLDQLLPWIHQWHPEIDPEFGETAGQSFETMLKADAHELGLTLEDIRAWEPPAKKKGGRRKGTTKDTKHTKEGGSGRGIG